MVHIVDGVLSLPVLAAGTALAAGGVALGLRRVEAEAVPRIALLSAAFFVASLVHIPVGPASAHLLLTGLIGLVLGWAAFPALLVGLILQAAFFGFGGLTVLGVNTLNMAVPAVLCGALFGALVRRSAAGAAALWGAAAGGLGVALTAVMVALSLALSGQAFVVAAQLILAAHLPVLAVEALLTGAAVGLLRRVRPEMLTRPESLARPEPAAARGEGSDG